MSQYNQVLSIGYNAYPEDMEENNDEENNDEENNDEEESEHS